jgi:hypothetical protein
MSNLTASHTITRKFDGLSTVRVSHSTGIASHKTERVSQHTLLGTAFIDVVARYAVFKVPPVHSPSSPVPIVDLLGPTHLEDTGNGTNI